MTRQSPSYASGRLTMRDLSPAEPLVKDGDAQQDPPDVSPLPLHKVSHGRVTKPSSAPGRTVRSLSRELGSNSRDHRRTGSAADGGLATPVFSKVRVEAEDQEPAQPDSDEMDVDEEDDGDESYDGGSDSDWDDYPRVRRKMAKYLLEKYTIDGCSQWTPFQAKLHKRLFLVEGYPVMPNEWKFPYFGAWVIPPGHESDSPLAPPAMRKRLAMKNYGDFFRALKSLKRVFDLSSRLAGYRQMDDMESRIAPTLAKELEAYWQWALKDASLDGKDCVRNVFVIPLGLEPGDSPDVSVAEAAVNGDDGDDAATDLTARVGNIQMDEMETRPSDMSQKTIHDRHETETTPPGRGLLPAFFPSFFGKSDPNTAPHFHPDLAQENVAIKDFAGTGTSASEVVRETTEQPFPETTSGGFQFGDDEGPDPSNHGEDGGEEERSATQLEQAIQDMGIREYGLRYRDLVEGRTGHYLATLDAVLFVIVQHRVMVCGLDISKPDSDLVVMTTFNMADTRQWLWNSLKLVVPIHMARDELVRLGDVWIDKPATREDSQDPDL